MLDVDNILKGMFPSTPKSLTSNLAKNRSKLVASLKAAVSFMSMVMTSKFLSDGDSNAGFFAPLVMPLIQQVIMVVLMQLAYSNWNGIWQLYFPWALRVMAPLDHMIRPIFAALIPTTFLAFIVGAAFRIGRWSKTEQMPCDCSELWNAIADNLDSTVTNVHGQKVCKVATVDIRRTAEKVCANAVEPVIDEEQAVFEQAEPVKVMRMKTEILTGLEAKATESGDILEQVENAEKDVDTDACEWPEKVCDDGRCSCTSQKVTKGFVLPADDTEDEALKNSVFTYYNAVSANVGELLSDNDLIWRVAERKNIHLDMSIPQQ